MKNSHMTYDDRLEIERGLKINASLTSIANTIGKDIGTVRKEIIKHRQTKYPSTFNGQRNICKHYVNKTCKRNYNYHYFNDNCNNHCPNYEEYICEKHTKKPYSCNGCDQKGSCHQVKRYYYAKIAEQEYRDELSSARKGPNLSNDELEYINSNVVPLVKKGQSFDNIIHANNNIDVPVCKQTLYNYTENQYIKLKNIDLPKKVTYKKRTKKTDNNQTENNRQSKIDKLKETRTYDEFLTFTSNHSNFKISEMDTVEGVKGGKLLLTLLFRDSNFMIALLIDDKMANTVNMKLNYLKSKLGITLFFLLFRILLTDNGVEFTMIEEIEKIEDKRINLFFCDAGKSGQKGKIEKNHVELRKILPKGISFDNLTQHDINIVLSHVNSYKRKELNWKAPIELVEEQYGHELIDILGYKKINDSDIILKPSLLQKTIKK